MSWFITGTDTGAGKTFVTCGLLHALSAQGCRAIAMKPIAAGLMEINGVSVNEDVACLQSNMAAPPPLSIINPYALPDPTAPHIAAARAGRRLELPPIEAAFEKARSAADMVLVEGVGGWCLPLNESQWLGDIPKVLRLPVLLVVGVRLGALNHALLTARAIQADGCRLDGWIANILDADYAYAQETIESLAQCLTAPLLGTLGWNPQSDPRQSGVVLEEAARWLRVRRTLE